MMSRRTMLLVPLASLAAAAPKTAALGDSAAPKAAGKKMSLALHQNTSAAAGYRKSLDGWARAGIKNVELTAQLLDEFLKTDSLAAARRVLTDLGLTPVSAACGVQGIWEPNPNHAAGAGRSQETLRDVQRTGAHAVVCADRHHGKIHTGRLQGWRGEHAPGR